MRENQTRGDAGEHLLKHDLRQRVAVGEVRVGRQTHPLTAVGATHPRALERVAAPAERDRRGLVAMPDGRAVRVVTALRTDDVIDLFGQQFGQHAEPDTDRQRRQTFLRRARQLAERLLHTLGQRVELRLLADLVGAFVYVPLVS